MIKRLLYVLICCILIAINYITLIPSFILWLVWLLVEVLYWICLGHTIVNEPMELIDDWCLWGSDVALFIKRKMKLNNEED